MLPTKDPSQNKRPTQTESEGVEKDIQSKWTGKKNWGNITCIGQNGFQNEGHKKRHKFGRYGQLHAKI